jgi:NTE family protein
VWTDIAEFHLPDALPCPAAATNRLASTATRLKAMDPELQQQLINWGYAACDAAMRKYGGAANVPPAAFPYPGGVGGA